MTGAEFITYVKVKINRLDTAAYEAVDPEEILFYGREAMKRISLDFDKGVYRGTLNSATYLNYLASITKTEPEKVCTDGAIALPLLLKLKDVQAYVTVGANSGWVPCEPETNESNSLRENNPFEKSFVDMPNYRLIDDKIQVVQNGFTCSKIKYEYLKYPDEITEVSIINVPYQSELEDMTATLVLENLESRRIETQPAISRSLNIV